MHLLDLLMYFVCVVLILLILGWLSGGELTQELGGMIGLIIIAIFTGFYLWFFVLRPDDYNWIDIFRGKQTINVNITL